MDKDGKYIGAFEGSKPKGGIEVKTAPEDARQVYSNGEWMSVPEAELAIDRLSNLDEKLPRWAEDLVEQGAYKLYGEAKEVFEEKQNLRASLK